MDRRGNVNSSNSQRLNSEEVSLKKRNSNDLVSSDRIPPSYSQQYDRETSSRISESISQSNYVNSGKANVSRSQPSTTKNPIDGKKRKSPLKSVSSTKTNPVQSKNNTAVVDRSTTSKVLNGISCMAIVLGIGAIAGTTLSIVKSNQLSSTRATQSQLQRAKEALKQHEVSSDPILGKELLPLKEQLKVLASRHPKLKFGIFAMELDRNSYVDIDAETSFSSASTIKLPVLFTLFQDIDAGKVHLDEKLTMTKEVMASGSGNMQYEKEGTQFTILEIATKMIAISDNTATNMLINRLGGAEALNQRFLELGLQSTAIHNPLPDLEGTNTTSPRDLGTLMIMIDKGESVSLRSRDRMLHIMRQTVRNTLIPEGLEKDALVAHKTGDIGSVLGDAAIVDMPNGKRYVLSILVNRPHNSPEAKPVIQEISRLIYQNLKKNRK